MQLTDLVNKDSPEAMLKEVEIILHLISSDFNTDPITTAFNLTIDLFRGNYPGYQACNTDYHDLLHSIDTFLTMARMVHGAVLEGEIFNNRHIVLSLIAALLHDVGYIQEEHDSEGTGSKYTACHVQRSMDFFKNYGSEKGFSETEITEGQTMILCTDPAVDLSTIEFPSPSVDLLGKMLGAADLLAQMADRIYLEKLLFLYYEFREANVGDYKSEMDLLRKTVGFYDFIAHRLETTLDAAGRFISSHLASRWDIHTNLYQKAIERQRNYLEQVLEMSDSDPRDSLKRGGIVEKVRKKYGESG